MRNAELGEAKYGNLVCLVICWNQSGSETRAVEMLQRVAQILALPGKTYRRMRKNVSKRTPHQKWKIVRDTCDYLLRLLGIHHLYDCKRNWRTPLCGLCAAQYTAFSLYTACYYWKENKISSIQPLTAMALVVPVIE